jgi:hypothetical protein
MRLELAALLLAMIATGGLMASQPQIGIRLTILFDLPRSDKSGPFKYC